MFFFSPKKNLENLIKATLLFLSASLMTLYMPDEEFLNVVFSDSFSLEIREREERRNRVCQMPYLCNVISPSFSVCVRLSLSLSLSLRFS